jgi:hypothetical protein
MTTFSQGNVLVLPKFLKNKNFINEKSPSFAEYLKNKYFVKDKSPKNVWIPEK